MTNYYLVKTVELPGSSYQEAVKAARRYFQLIKRKSKRKPYIRSAYFRKQKVFFDFFWDHLLQKPRSQRIGRLKIIPCGIELLQYSTVKPIIAKSLRSDREILYRFYGRTKNGVEFIVQVKELPKSRQLISVYPVE